jgi:cytochrome c-type biogenesis protein CcmE|tara:strand:+ start:591 stop:1010 length:420 start_codon:yes stop_codon:yes gene_type:complete
MYGKKVKLRILFLSLLLLSIILTIFLILNSLRDNVIYFKSPTEIKLLKELTEKKIRIGGMVKKNSIKTTSNKLNFIITDFKNEINVSYSGAVPNLFEEEKGVVAEGFLKDRNFFIAKKILAKHDENYMPPEVKKALEQN